MDIVLKAWTEDALQYKGRYFTIPVPGWKEKSGNVKVEPPYYAPDGEYVAVRVMPRPYQKPHPPVWGMVGSDESYA